MDTWQEEHIIVGPLQQYNDNLDKQSAQEDVLTRDEQQKEMGKNDEPVCKYVIRFRHK